MSISTILPSLQTQQHNYDRWKQLFNETNLSDFRSYLESKHWSTNSIDQIAGSPFEPLTIEELKETLFSPILDSLIQENNPEDFRVYTLVEDDPSVSKLVDFTSIPNTYLVSPSVTSLKMNTITIRQFRNLLSTAFTTVIIGAFFLFPNRRILISVLLPFISGLVVMFGSAGWTQEPLTMFHAVAALLIIGLGIDYGVMISHLSDSPNIRNTRKAITVSSLTTLAGFLSLTISSHPVLFTLGKNVSIGIAVTALTALFISPLLLPSHKPTPDAK